MHTEKLKVILFLLFSISVPAGCDVFAQEGAKIASPSSKTANPYLNPYEARSYQGKLEIFKDGNSISVIRSQKPMIERWGFIDSGNHVVVRSRGEHGPAVFELFETSTGALQDKVVSSEFNNRLPPWAIEFSD